MLLRLEEPGLERTTIFGKQFRSDASRKTEAEGDYRFLNRVAGQYWDDVRDLMEAWFAPYPDHKAPELARRFQADSQGFSGAYLELFLHQLFSQSDASMVVEPEVSKGRPDFRVSIDGESFLVEATTVNEPGEHARRDRMMEMVMDDLRKVQSADFYVSIDSVVQGSKRPSGRKMADDLSEWLSKLRWDDVRATQGRGADGIPTTTLENGGWTIKVGARPKREDRRIPGPLVISAPMKGRVATDYATITDRLKTKAKTYRTSGEPIVLAFMNTRWTAGLGETAPALFGAAWEHPEMLRERRIQGGFRPSGLWLNHEGSHYNEVVAVIEVAGVNPWYLADGRVTAWHNPDTSRRAIESLEIDHFTVVDGSLQRRESSRPLVEVLGIPRGWPRGEAFLRG